MFLCSHLLEQVQEVCDHVGIIFNGKLVKEGRLQDLISIEDQTEVIIRNASDRTLARIRAVLSDSENAEFVRMGKPRTTLERLVLEEAKKSVAQDETGDRCRLGDVRGEAGQQVDAEYGSGRETGDFQNVGHGAFGGADGALALAQDMPEDYWTEL